MTGFSGGGHEHSRFSLAEMLALREGLGSTESLLRLATRLVRRYASDFSVSSEFEHGTGTGQNKHLYELLHRSQVTRVPEAAGCAETVFSAVYVLPNVNHTL